MRLFVRMTFAVLASALLAGLVAPIAVQADETDKVVEYFRKKVNLPPSVPAKAGSLTASPIKGVKQGVIEVGNQKQPFVMSNDGRYVVFGTMSELGNSPIKGAKSGVVAVGNQELPLFISEDGRYAVVGSVDDVTVNPYEQTMKKISLKGRASKGPENAKVTIVEYSDFQCTYCALAYQTLENRVLKEYGDKVRFVFKHFPLNFHNWAEAGAIAVECARLQDEPGYWKLYSALFENQNDINPQNLKDKAHTFLAGTKVDLPKFDECLDGKKTTDVVQADQQEATAIGVKGTPAFFINGRPLSGAQPLEAFKAVIDDELAQK